MKISKWFIPRCILLEFFICIEWMFLGMTFFLEWKPFIELGVIVSLALAGWISFPKKELRSLLTRGKN